MPARTTTRFLLGKLRADWPLLPILLVAAVLRMGWPELSEFKYDEARLSALALDWVQGGPLPLAGMTSSTGVSNPPVSVYLVAIPYALSPSPVIATLFVGLLNVLAVAGCYALARRWHGPAAAWSSALLFACAPWAVLYSRKLWAQDMLAPLVLLCVAAAYLALVEGRTRWLVLWPVAVSLAVQLHFSAIVLALWMLALLVVFRGRIGAGLAALGTGMALGVLAWAPYLVYLSQHWLSEAAHVASQMGRPTQLDATALHYAWLLATGSEIHSLAGPATFRAFLASLPPYEPLFALAGLLALAGLGRLVWHAWRGSGRERDVAALVVLWCAAPLVLFTRHSLPVYPHYFIVLLPAPFLAAGALVAAVEKWPRRPGGVAGRVALPALVVLLAAVQAGVFAALLAFVAGRATPGGFGTPLRYWLEVADRVRGTPACDVRIFSDGDNPLYHEIPAIFDVLLRGDERVHYENHNEQPQDLDLPAHTALYVMPVGAARSMSGEWMSGAGPPVYLRPGEGDISFLYVGRHERPPTGGPSATFANGVRLLDAYAELKASGDVYVFLRWALTDPPPTEIHVFNHLLDSAGERRGQADGAICPAATWQEGLEVWTWFRLSIDPAAAPGALTVRSGLYRYPDVVNVGVLDGKGAPAGEWVEWRPDVP